MNDNLKRSFYPLETGLVDLPGTGSRALLLNAPAGMRLPAGFDAEPALVQDFRPAFLALRNAGFTTTPEFAGSGYDVAFVFAGRHRRQNELWIAEALTHTRAGALVVVSGGKTDGIASLRKRVGALLPLGGSQAKFHGTVFWLERPADIVAACDALRPPEGKIAGSFATGPGMFSADHVDAGSKLLADSLPEDLAGSAADFGAGWGYLTARLLQHGAIRSIDLYEASHAALEAAKTNLAGSSVPCRFFWHDLLSEPVTERYDIVVMNPPFHQARAAEPDIGIAMIRAALGALKKGGRLFLVANRGLPYEAVLRAGASSHGELIGDARYRVLWAAR